MEFVFDDFRQTIQELKAAARLTDEIGLVLHGRMQYAAERGDITLVQLGDLERLLGIDFMERHRTELAIASLGLETGTALTLVGAPR